MVKRFFGRLLESLTNWRENWTNRAWKYKMDSFRKRSIRNSRAISWALASYDSASTTFCVCTSPLEIQIPRRGNFIGPAWGTGLLLWWWWWLGLSWLRKPKESQRMESRRVPQRIGCWIDKITDDHKCNIDFPMVRFWSQILQAQDTAFVGTVGMSPFPERDSY